MLMLITNEHKIKEKFKTVPYLSIVLSIIPCNNNVINFM